MNEKKLNLTIEAENVAWVEFMAALSGTSMNAYINEAIRHDLEGAPQGTKEAYEAFIAARGKSPLGDRKRSASDSPTQ